jgi:hypothetical protein
MDCGVCLTFDDSSSWEDYEKTEPLAEAPTECSECGEKIPPGTKFIKVRGLTENQVWDEFDICCVCHEIMEAFCCDGIMYGGMFWEEMWDYAFENLNTSCFDKLQSPQAKSELRRRWSEWRFRD